VGRAAAGRAAAGSAAAAAAAGVTGADAVATAAGVSRIVTDRNGAGHAARRAPPRAARTVAGYRRPPVAPDVPRS
jgi:hypothetical protein